MIFVELRMRMSKAVWDVEEYSLKKGEWKFRLVRWASVLLSILAIIFAAIVGNRHFHRDVLRPFGRMLKEKAAEQGVPWLVLIPGVLAALLLVGGVILCARSDYALNAVPVGLFGAGSLLFAFLPAHADVRLSAGITVAVLVLLVLGIVSLVAVERHCRKHGKPVLKRYDVPVSFWVSALIFGLLLSLTQL